MLSNESRKRLIDALRVIKDSKIVAEIFSVDRSTVSRISKQMRTTGSVALRTSQRGRKASLKEAEVQSIRKLLTEQPDITVKEIVETLHLQVCNETVRKKIVELGYVYKKKSLHASERERPRRSGEEKALVKEYGWTLRE